MPTNAYKRTTRNMTTGRLDATAGDYQPHNYLPNVLIAARMYQAVCDG